MAVRVRVFGEADLDACLAVTNAVDPEHSIGLPEGRRDYFAWNVERYHRSRYMAEDEAGEPGWGQIAHVPWQFHPDKYALRIEVDPRHRRRGVGGQLLVRLLEELRERRALLARAVATEGDAESVDFLTRRAFREVWRNLESHLELASFDPTPFLSVAERVERQGIAITTLAAELAREPDTLRLIYDLHTACNATQEELDTFTTPRPFEDWVASEVEGPRSIPEAYFLARDGQRFVGLSSLERVIGADGTLEAGYTAVDPTYRGRGIALALKLQAIAYARRHGYHRIKTDSSAVNERMLGINRALGFQPLPARITFELPLA